MDHANELRRQLAYIEHQTKSGKRDPSDVALLNTRKQNIIKELKRGHYDVPEPEPPKANPFLELAEKKPVIDDAQQPGIPVGSSQKLYDAPQPSVEDKIKQSLGNPFRQKSPRKKKATT